MNRRFREKRFLKYSLPRFLLTAIAGMAAILACGCGGSSVIFAPNLGNPELHSQNLKREKAKIVRVTDGRRRPTKDIGTVHVGLFNKSVPYLLEGDLGDVVKSMLDTLIVVPGDQVKIIPIQVSADVFEVGENISLFSEEGYFACNLRFTYPVTPDSTCSRSLFSKQTTSGMDVTGDLEPLIYKGVADCARSFVTTVLDKSPGLEVAKDSVRTLAVLNPTPSSPGQSREPGNPEQNIAAEPSRHDASEIDFHYLKGSKVTIGARVAYSMLNAPRESDLLWGLGISFTYFHVKNTADFLEGNFANFGGRLVGRKFFTAAQTTPYIGGGFGLVAGTEKIDQGTGQDASFFFGPSVDECLGISFNRMVSLEFGTYQIAYFGSKLLPSDIGIIAGISIGL